MSKILKNTEIYRNSSITNETKANSASITKTVKNSHSNSAITDPWVFDFVWTAYPQLEGKLKLYFTFNPEFPLHVDTYNVKPGYVVIQVAPSGMGGFVNKQWTWNSNVAFDINEDISSTYPDKLSDGKPITFNFSANSGTEYDVICFMSKNSNPDTNGFLYHGTFTMPTLFSSPSKPTSSGNTIKVTVNDDEAYTTALEFRNTATPPVPWKNYDSDTRALFFETACQQTENSLEKKYWNNKKFKIWSKVEHTIGVNFMSSVPANERNDYIGYVQQTVNKINETIGGSGFKLKIIDGITNGSYSNIENRKGNGEIQVWWGTYEELWNESPSDNWRYFGEWNNNWDDSNKTYLTKGWVKLCTEKVWEMNYQGITWEEIIECLGVGNDMVHDAFSAFSDFWFPAKSLNKYNGTLTPYDKDLNVLRMAYNHDLPSNLEPWDCANRIYAPNGYYYNFHGYNDSGLELSFDISGLNIGDTYIFKAISLDYNNSSKFTNEIRHTIEITKPSEWVWSSGIAVGKQLTVDANGIHPVTAVEWNNFTKRINEFRQYKGYSNYNFTTVSKNQKFTPAIYNEAVAAIKGVTGYGNYVYYIDNDTIAISNCKFQINLLESLSNEANAIVGYT